MNTVELLAPAGNPEALDAAIGEGADAIYLGLKNFNARIRSSNFAYSQFEAAVEQVHKLGKKIYLTVNTVFEERESDRMFQLLGYVDAVKPDGIIVQDLGIVRMTREHFPAIKLHASTQMNIESSRGANFLSKFGFNRIVLARELDLPQIRAIRETTNVELETFIHGALCVSCSGLCLFSSYLGGKSANRGSCAQACRRLYTAEDKSGYFFSPDDLELLQVIPGLIEAGVSSLKIEGRMKSAEYVGAVVSAYRIMIDDYGKEGGAALERAARILKNDFARNKTEYFFSTTAHPDFLHPDQSGGTGIKLGTVKEIRARQGGRFCLVKMRSGVAEGDSIRIHAGDDSERKTCKVAACIEEEDGLLLSLTEMAKPGDVLYLVQTKSMTKRHKNILPNSLSSYRRLPGRETAPALAPRKFAKDLFKDSLDGSVWLPEGIYAQVSRVEDLYLLQSLRPAKAILALTRKNAELVRAKGKTLPFRGNELILSLDPYFPESEEAWLKEEIECLAGSGYRSFILNNLGHVPLLRKKGLNLIAGPYLYSFNSYAADFLQETDLLAIIPPLEISKQNLQKIAERVNTQAYLFTVFAYPALFKIKADLSRNYRFRFFSGKNETEGFELVAGNEGSVVIPGIPFSLTDKLPVLQKHGIKRFILDFSWAALKKPLYRQVISAAMEGRALAQTSRFNWKDGFWNPPEAGGQGSSQRQAVKGKKENRSPEIE